MWSMVTDVKAVWLTSSAVGSCLLCAAVLPPEADAIKLMWSHLFRNVLSERLLEPRALEPVAQDGLKPQPLRLREVGSPVARLAATEVGVLARRAMRGVVWVGLVPLLHLLVRVRARVRVRVWVWVGLVPLLPLLEARGLDDVAKRFVVTLEAGRHQPRDAAHLAHRVAQHVLVPYPQHAIRARRRPPPPPERMLKPG